MSAAGGAEGDGVIFSDARRARTKASTGIFDFRLGIFDGRDGGALGRGEGPVLVPRGAFGDPAFEEIFLCGGERAVGLGRRHHVVGIVAENAGDELAVGGFAGDDGGVAGFADGEGALAAVEAEFGFAGGFVRAVAVVAVFREDRLDVAFETDRRIGGAETGDGGADGDE
jgi:hypothetical protein